MKVHFASSEPETGLGPRFDDDCRRCGHHGTNVVQVFSIVMPTVEGDDIPVELRICQSTHAPDAFL